MLNKKFDADNKLERCAVHEAGHAVSAWRFTLPLESIVI
jgi:hypothetical protein